MKAEIIAVGSELLLGQITNTNAQFISARLAEIGVDVYYQTVAGDNPARLEEAIRIAEERADLLVFSGGLGPTKDDLTKETIARHIGRELEMDTDALHSIEAYFERTGRQMTANNRKQALVLDGSSILANHHGMAPGMALAANGHYYMLLPGPPHEMEPMFENLAIPYLHELLGRKEAIVSTVVKFYGIGEAELAFKVRELLDSQTNPTIAPLASRDGVTLRLTAKADTPELARELILPVVETLQEQVGEFIYGFDDDTLSSKAAELLLERGLSISAAESLTAGLFTSLLAEQPGISGALKGGVTVYTKEEKISQLGLESAMLERYGVISSECAGALAASIRERFRTDIGIGLTGAAGPDPHDGQPAGTVWIGIASPDRSETYQLKLSGSRNTNRMRAANYALFHLIRMLQTV